MFWIIPYIKKVKIKSVLADGAYDSNTNFRYLEKKRITPGIKVRKNSIVSPKNNRLRNREVRLQTKRFVEMEEEKKVWITDGWLKQPFHLSKRMFGEYVSATRFQNMVKEMMIKVSLYNLFRRI